MDPNSDLTQPNNQNLFLQIANTTDHSALTQLLEKHQQQLNSTDSQGNTLLHYAVMVPVNLPLLQKLIAMPGITLNAQNHQNEAAADWLEYYLYSMDILVDEDKADLDQIPQKIAESDTNFIISLLEANISLQLRYRTPKGYAGETLLHVALDYQYHEIVQKLYFVGYYRALQNGDTTFRQVLYTLNCHGERPIDKKNAQAMLSQAQAQLAAITPTPFVTVSPWLLLKENIGALNAVLLAPTSAHQHELLGVRLPIFCVLAAFVCQSALDNFRLQYTKRKEQLILEKLFGKNYEAEKLTKQLRQKIAKIKNYFYSLVQQDRVSQSITLSTQRSTDRGWFDPSKNKIYLNPNKTTDLISAMRTLLHEASHLVAKTYDFKGTYPPILEKSRYIFNFKPCYQLAQKGKILSNNSSEKMQDLLKCQAILQHGKVPADFNTIYYPFLALNNAESIATFIMALGTDSQLLPNCHLAIPLNCFSEKIVTRRLDQWAIAASQCLSPPRKLYSDTRTPTTPSTDAGSNSSGDETASSLQLSQDMSALRERPGESAVAIQLPCFRLPPSAVITTEMSRP